MTPERRAWYALMMADRVREDAFRRALRLVAPGRVVLDLGAGLGALSAIALEEGAERVVALDVDGEALAEAREGLLRPWEGRVEYVVGSSLEVCGLERCCDVLVAELLDASGVGENIVEVLGRARAGRLLRPGGVVVPRTLELHAAALYEEDVPDDLGPERGGSPRICDLPAGLAWCRWSPLIPWGVLETPRPGLMAGIGLAFTAGLAPGVSLSNLPGLPATHWRQAAVMLAEPLWVGPGPGERVDISGAVTPRAGSPDVCDVAFGLRRAAVAAGPQGGAGA